MKDIDKNFFFVKIIVHDDSIAEFNFQLIK